LYSVLNGIATLYESFVHQQFVDVLLLAADETPDLVALQPLALQVAENAVLVAVAGRADFDQQAGHRALLTAQHAADGTDGIAFDKGGKDPAAFVNAQAVHTPIIRNRSRIVKMKVSCAAH
jgi:hypothetical protein